MSKKWLYLGAGSILLMTLLFYIPAMRGGYVWDDDIYVTNNLTLTTFNGLQRIWLEIGAVPQYYPLVHTSFWLEYHLWQLHPFGYHLVNVLLHALNSILLWFVLRCLSIPGAWFAAAIFALHPVHVESVAWITERKNVLSGFFYLSAVLAYLRFLRLGVISAIDRYRWGYYFLALVLYLCAILSKTVVCTMPAIILILLWWQQDRVGWRDVLLLTPHFALGVALALTTVWLEKYVCGTVGEEWAFSFLERCLIAGRALWFYARMLIWPNKLIFIYPRWQINVGIWWQYLFPLAAVAVFSVLWFFRKQIGKAPLTAALFFSCTLAPALGFVDFYFMRYSFVGDHFQYLASIGLIVLCTAVINNFFLQRVPSYRNSGFVVFGAIILIFGMLVWQQGYIYKDAETLFRDTIAKNPNCWMPHHNRGMALVAQGKLDEGIECYKKALTIAPQIAGVHINLSTAYYKKGRFDEAISECKKALNINPNSFLAHNNLGIFYTEKGWLEEAIAELEKALSLNPRLAKAHHQLGNVYLLKDELDKAISEYKQTIAIEPDYVKSYTNMGLAYFNKGMLDDSISIYKKALRINPNLAEAQYNLSIAYYYKGNYKFAILHSDKAEELGLSINPRFLELLKPYR